MAHKPNGRRLKSRFWIIIWIVCGLWISPSLQYNRFLYGSTACLESTSGNGTAAVDNARCDCWERDGDGGVEVDCRDMDMEHTPTGLPARTRTLTLSGNVIGELPSAMMHHVTQLTELFVDDNIIEVIAPNAFRNLLDLTTLTLSNNRLRHIDGTTFANLHRLKELDLHGNQITRISSATFTLMPLLLRVQLQDNPIHCDCDALRIKERALASGRLMLSGFSCQNFAGRDLFDIGRDEFGTCPDPVASCYSCVDASSLDQCERDPPEDCGDPESACHTQVSLLDSGLQRFTSGCSAVETCIAGVAGNVAHCRDGKDAGHCGFCCAGPLCNHYSNGGFPGYNMSTAFEAEFIALESWQPELNDTSSPEFMVLATKIQRQLDWTFATLNGTYDSTVRHFGEHENGTVAVAVTVPTTLTLGTCTARTQDALLDALIAAAWDSHGEVAMLPDSVHVYSSGTCSRERLTAAAGAFTWPATFSGDTAALPCPVPAAARAGRAEATRACTGGAPAGRWSAPDLSACADTRELTLALRNLTQQPVNTDTVDAVAVELSALTNKDANNLTAVEVDLSVQVLDNIIAARGSTSLSHSSTQAVLHSVDNLMAAHRAELIEAEVNSNASTRLLHDMDLLGIMVNVTSSQKREQGSWSSFVEAQVTLTVQDTAVDVGEGLVFVQTAQKEISLERNVGAVEPSENVKILIPRQAFLTGAQGSEVVTFHVYDSDILFEVVHTAAGSDPITNDLVHTQKSNSAVVAASFGEVKISDLSSPVVITFPHSEQKDSEAVNETCSFWHYTDDQYDRRGGGSWSTAGCRLALTSTDHQRRVSQCHCDHLTNFALIMDIYRKNSTVGAGHQKALSIISYMGVAISIICLVATIFTYTYFRSLTKDNPSKILLQLCIALLGVMLLFIVTTVPSVRASHMACKVSGALLHVLLLAAWAWMAVEAGYMYVALVKVFDTYIHHFLLKCCILAWGLPAVAVGITVGVNTDNYGDQGGICWLAPAPFYWACLLPIAAVLLLNFSAFFMVIHKLRSLNIRGKYEKTQQAHKMRKRLRGAVSLVVLLGLTWVFAVFAVGAASLLFNYLFAVCNSFQGLFIFIFYCLWKKDAQRAWKSVLPCYRVPDGTTISRSSKAGGSGGCDTMSTPVIPPPSRSSQAPASGGHGELTMGESTPPAPRLAAARRRSASAATDEVARANGELGQMEDGDAYGDQGI